MIQSEDKIMHLKVDLSQYKEEDFILIQDLFRSKVYRARIPLISNGPLVDCAIIVNILSTNQEINDFYSSIEKQASLNHPCILPILGYTTPSNGRGFYSIITPYMANGDLLISLQDQDIGLNTTTAIIIYGIAAGMAYMQQNNIIHKNLKPEKIILDENLFPKITGFRYSEKIPNGVQNEANIQFRGGTVYYSPPEGDSNILVDPSKFDVFSFGIILYIIFTFEHPFFDEAGIADIKDGSRPSLEKVLPQFHKLIEKSWNCDPDNRPSFIDIVKDMSNRMDYYFADFNLDSKKFLEFVEIATNGLNINPTI